MTYPPGNPDEPFTREDIEKMFVRAQIGGWFSLVKASDALQDERVHEAVAYATAGNQLLTLADRLTTPYRKK